MEDPSKGEPVTSYMDVYKAKYNMIEFFTS